MGVRRDVLQLFLMILGSMLALERLALKLCFGFYLSSLSLTIMAVLYELNFDLVAFYAIGALKRRGSSMDWRWSLLACSRNLNSRKELSPEDSAG